MKRKIFLAAAIICLVVGTVYWISYVPHFYKHSAVTGMVLDNEELLIRSVKEMDKLSVNNNIVESVRKSANITDQNIKIELSYVSSMDREEFYKDDWREKSLQELADEYGAGAADRICLLRNIYGLYACYSYESDKGIQDCYVEIQNQTLAQVFNQTDVNYISYWTDSIDFNCYERSKVSDMEYAGFFYYKSGEPDPPEGFYAKTKKTKNGWLYKSKYSMSYQEKITGHFYYFDDDGHDAV